MKGLDRKINTYPFLEGGGELGVIVRNYNWSSSSLGDIHEWPQSLRTTLGNILHSAFPMFLFWGEDLLCFYNDAYRPSLGNRGKHPAVGKKGKDVWPEVWDFIGPLIEEVQQSGSPVWYENRLVPIFRNGKIEDVYWTFSYSPAYNDDGEIGGVLVTCMETTDKVLADRKIEETVAIRTAELEEAHSALLRANNYLQQIINLFREPLQVLEPVVENGNIVDFRYKLTNMAYSAYANTTPEHLHNKKVGEIFPGYYETNSFLKVAETCKTRKEESWEIHYDKDGLDLYNLMSATMLGNDVVVHFTDFTKLKYLELELLEKIKELERSNQQLEEFAHAASHDLKEPIRKVMVFASMLRDILGKKLTAHEIYIFDKIDNSVRRMVQLVDDLLLFSHFTQKPHKKQPVDLNKTMQQILEDLEVDIQQKAAVVVIDPLPVVSGYQRQLQQLFQNLISNALKYSHPGVAPQLHISCSKVDLDHRNYHLLEVADNGIGFEQIHAEKIFQLFTRLHGRNTYSGTGIGLSIAKKITENHEGMIAAESSPGEGSTFKVWLPA